MKKLLCYVQVLILAMFIVSCGHKEFAVPKPVYEITITGDGDSLRYLVSSVIPENIDEQLLCKVVDGDTIVLEWQRYNPVYGQFEPFRTYQEGIKYARFINEFTNRNEILKEATDLQLAYDEERRRILAEEAKWQEYQKKLVEKESENLPIIKEVINDLINQGENPGRIGPLYYLSNIAFEFHEPTGELKTYKGKNYLGANVEYTYYVENDVEVKHGKYRSWQEYNDYSTPYTYSQGTIWIDGKASLECEYINGKVHGRLRYQCDAMVKWSRGLSAEHVKENKTFYIYKNIIDGDNIKVSSDNNKYTLNSIMGIIRNGEVRNWSSIKEIEPTRNPYGIDRLVPEYYDFGVLTLAAPGFIEIPYITR